MGELYEMAIEAINAVADDPTVSSEEAYASLEALRDQLEIIIEDFDFEQ